MSDPVTQPPPAPRLPRRLITALFALSGIFLLLFFAAEALGIPLLNDPTGAMAHARWEAAAIGVGLLAGDVFLPVPSSIVMAAHGTLFGVTLGASLSMLGSMLACWIAYYCGASGHSILEKFLNKEEQAQAHAWLERHGLVAIVITRPLPMLAEAVALLAGASGMRILPYTLACAAGSLPPSLLYAWAGAHARDAVKAGESVNVWLMFGLVLALAGALWFLSRFLDRAAEPKEKSDGSEEAA